MSDEQKTSFGRGMNDNTLPEGFTGVFYFTNFTDRDTTHKWNNVAYTFPAMKTSPMIIPTATAEEIQHIRKKFARELAEREFYHSERYKGLDAQARPGSGNTPAIYTDEDLAPFVQRCLEPLPVGQAEAKNLPRDSAERYRKDEEGNNITAPVAPGKSLIQETGSVMVG